MHLGDFSRKKNSTRKISFKPTNSAHAITEHTGTLFWCAHFSACCWRESSFTQCWYRYNWKCNDCSRL